MAIEVIPNGCATMPTIISSDRAERGDRWERHERDHKEVEIMAAIKDAQASLERSTGIHYADTVKTIKDSEANLDRAGGDRFMQTVQDIKDAEARLERSSGDRFMQVIQDVKDAETRLDKSGGDRFIQTIQDIKDAAKDVALSGAHNVEVTKEGNFQTERSQSQTRELVAAGFKDLAVEVCEGFDEVKGLVERDTKEILVNQLKEFAQADKTACHNQTMTLLQFKEQALLSDRHAASQALLSERLAAKQELLSEKLAAQAAAQAAECCCEIKELIRTDGDRTRALVNEQEVQRLRDRALKAEAGLAAFFAAKVPPTVPVI